jgi:hypothetical protein
MSRAHSTARTHTPANPPPIEPGARQREQIVDFVRKPRLRPNSLGVPKACALPLALDRGLALCLLLWPHAAGQFLNRRAQLLRSPRTGAVSHPHGDVVGNRVLHHAVGGSIADFAAECPLRMWPISNSACPSAWRRLIRAKRLHMPSCILRDAANLCRTTQQTARNVRCSAPAHDARSPGRAPNGSATL